MILEDLKTLKREMRTLRQMAKLVDLYHNQMDEFDNLKMEYAFMKA
jgi:hypothetical protein